MTPVARSRCSSCLRIDACPNDANLSKSFGLAVPTAGFQSISFAPFAVPADDFQGLIVPVAVPTAGFFDFQDFFGRIAVLATACGLFILPIAVPTAGCLEPAGLLNF